MMAHPRHLTLAVPACVNEALSGFVGAIANRADSGGRRRAPDHEGIHGEGLQMPILKLYETGLANEILFEIIRQNIRVANEVHTDLHSIIGSCEQVSTGVNDVSSAYGLDDLDDLSSQFIGFTDTPLRKAIREARPDSDVVSTSSFPTNASSTPTEVLERGLSLRI